MNTSHTSSNDILNNKGSKAGFTLIEIMVSLAIFTVVAVIATGAFLKIIDANKQSQALQTAMNNTNFALDSMVREMRVGTKYNCYDATNGSLNISSLTSGTACAFNQYTYPEIAFNSSVTSSLNGNCNLIHAYRFYSYNGGATSTIQKAEQTTCTDVIGSSAAPFIPLIAADLNVTQFKVKVNTGVTNQQPDAFFLINAYAGPTVRERTYFSVQSTVSERTMRNP